MRRLSRALRRSSGGRYGSALSAGVVDWCASPSPWPCRSQLDDADIHGNRHDTTRNGWFLDCPPSRKDSATYPSVIRARRADHLSASDNEHTIVRQPQSPVHTLARANGRQPQLTDVTPKPRLPKCSSFCRRPRSNAFGLAESRWHLVPP